MTHRHVEVNAVVELPPVGVLAPWQGPRGEQGKHQGEEGKMTERLTDVASRSVEREGISNTLGLNSIGIAQPETPALGDELCVLEAALSHQRVRNGGGGKLPAHSRWEERQ